MKTRIIALIAALVLAAVGGVLLFDYVRNADVRAAQGAELTEVLFVAEEIQPGTSAAAIESSVEPRSIPLAFVAEGAVTDLDQLAGLVTTATLLPGEQVLAARFATPEGFAGAGGTVPVPEGMQEISVPIDASRVAGGRIAPGDVIGVFVTMGEGAESPAQTRLVLDRVLVTAVSGAEQSGTVVLNLAVSERDAQTIVFAAENARLWFSKQNDATDPATGESFTRTDLG